MYTQCPHCQTCFRVSEAHLKAARGRVRCGSCQEVFDASQYLYNNLTEKQPIKRAAEQPARPVLPEQETDHIDLSAPPAPRQPVQDLRKTREQAPDQNRFMQSISDNGRYNDLDKMGSISIPGELNFSDSFIGRPKQKEDAATPQPLPETRTESRTQYEDTESKESAATDEDRASIRSLFAAADSQLHGDEEKSQLDRDIDELLAFANNLDIDQKDTQARQSTQPKQRGGVDDEDEFDLDALAEFEAQLPQAQPAEELPDAPDESTGLDVEEIELSDAPSDDFEPPAQVKRASLDEDIPRALRRSLDQLNAMPTRSPGRTLGLLALIVVLLTGLVFQFVLFRNAELVRLFPSLTPFVSSACDTLPCRYTGQADVRQIRLLNRDVRSHPTQKNALLISAAFVNEAAFDQPYPSIQITLSDLGGNVVASRRFTPQEYLEDMYNRFILLESGTPVHVTLAVLDPGSDAINFEFSFL